ITLFELSFRLFIDALVRHGPYHPLRLVVTSSTSPISSLETSSRASERQLFDQPCSLCRLFRDRWIRGLDQRLRSLHGFQSVCLLPSHSDFATCAIPICAPDPPGPTRSIQLNPIRPSCMTRLGSTRLGSTRPARPAWTDPVRPDRSNYLITFTFRLLSLVSNMVSRV
ncbi:hypothetical protein PIB30_104247, partial [Stylosanthes scabra]|nr:hypothetical protein [Stylosanthes scabra]